MQLTSVFHLSLIDRKTSYSSSSSFSESHGVVRTGISTISFSTGIKAVLSTTNACLWCRLTWLEIPFLPLLWIKRQNESLILLKKTHWFIYRHDTDDRQAQRHCLSIYSQHLRNQINTLISRTPSYKSKDWPVLCGLKRRIYGSLAKASMSFTWLSSYW